MRFMDIHHNMTGISEEELRRAHHEDAQLEGEEGVHFVHAWADPTTGKVFCLSEGPSKEAVQRVHERAGHPADEIYEVPYEAE